MSERNLRVLRLVLEVLDVWNLKVIWTDHAELRQYFVGIALDLEGVPLVLFSIDFCQAVFTAKWNFGHQLAMDLMRNDFIDYSVYVIRQLGIESPYDLAEIVMRNGRKAALDAVPHRNEVLETIEFYAYTIFPCYLSDELYDFTDSWHKIFEGQPQMYKLAHLVEKALAYESSVMVDWIRKNLELHKIEWKVDGIRRNALEEARDSAQRWWAYEPAISLVNFLLAQ